MDKIPAHFRKTHSTAHLFQRLRQCRRCGRYTCLWHEACPACHAEGVLASTPHLAERVMKRRLQGDLLIAAAFGAAAFALAHSFAAMAGAAAGALLLMALYYGAYRRYRPYLYRRTLARLLLQDRTSIRSGLLGDIDEAEADLKNQDYKSAYEKFREIGYFLRNDHIKAIRLHCLSRFILRSDMELELSTLLPSRFDKDFILYLQEIGRVRPQLIGTDVLDYVTRHRTAIELLPEGAAVLTAAAGAALRIQGQLAPYYGLVLGYADRLPKERLQRLARLLESSPGSYPELRAKVQDTVRSKYADDPELSPLL